jgi:methyl-accepting chemotaxis protein
MDGREESMYAVRGDPGGGTRSLADSLRADAVREWSERMKQAEHSLETMTSRTEEEFLTIGSVLRDLYRRAKKVSDLSSSVAARMTGTEIVRAIDDLNGLLERMERYLQSSEDETKRRIGNLRRILNVVEGLGDPLEDFRRITKTLRSLNITARVQNASLVTRNGELDVLLNEVRALSDVMTAKSDAIRKDLRLLEHGVKQALSQVLMFEERQQGKARAVLDGTMSVICSVTEQYGLSTAAARDIADHFGEISRSIGEIVTAVQFHDITRQHFDRIRKAVNNALEHLCGLPEDPYFMPDTTRMAFEVERSCKEQASELISVRDTFVTAVRGMTDHLNRIAEKVAACSDDTRRIVGHEGSGSRTFLGVTKGALSSVTSSFAAISESAEAGSELAASVRSLTDRAAEVAEFIDDIEGIADEVELIAFNTEIKSSRMGAEGATFEVVATGIRKLSADTSSWVGTITEKLKFVASAADELSPGNRPETAGISGEVSAISGDLESLMSSLSGVNDNVLSLFADIDRAGRALSGDIIDIVKHIRVQTVVDRAVESVAAELSETASLAHLMVPAGERAARKDEVYVIRNNRVTAGDIVEGDGIEFF